MTTPSRPPLRLLIVDDDEELRATLVSRFERTGAAVTAAGSGEEALGRAARGRLDVALLDLHLPGMDGIEVLARLKEMQPEVEVLLLTAHSSIETAVQAMKRGAYDYLTKPFRLAELEVHVQKAHEKVPGGPPRTPVGRAGPLRVAAPSSGRLQPGHGARWSG